MKKQKKHYLVVYSKGGWDTHTTVEVFVTDNQALASRWVLKFNRILETYENYYLKLTNELYTEQEISCYAKHISKRYDTLWEYGKAFYSEIEKR